MKSIPIATVILICVLSFSAFAAPGKAVVRSDKVERYMVEANAAWGHLQDVDLAGMEGALAAGLAEITDMVDSYALNTLDEDRTRTNTYLRKRGWGHLVWTQIMYRLLAIRNGVYEQELEFAEQVALEGVARTSLENVESSVGAFAVLLEAKDLFGFGDQIDEFAQTLIQDGDRSADYQRIIADFETRFAVRKRTVIARLESQRHPGIVDPDVLAAGSGPAAAYHAHRDRLADADTRLDEILHQLADYDAEQVVMMASEADDRSGLDAFRVELMVFEDALDASESDPAVLRMLDLYEQQGALAFTADEASDIDFRDAMILIHSAQRSLADNADADALREFYSLGDQAR